MKTSIRFGTDGWRAIIAEDFTFDNVRLCAQATADHLNASGLASRGLIVGYDTRFASEDFASAVAEVVSANGIKTFLCDKATPTPVVSYATMARKAGGAVIITASHNPGSWNGYKIKSELGTSAPPEATTRVEANIQRISGYEQIKRMPLSQAIRQGTVERVDLSPIYYEQMNRLVDVPSLRNSKMGIVVDPMHGAGIGYLKTLLRVVRRGSGKRNTIATLCSRAWSGQSLSPLI